MKKLTLLILAVVVALAAASAQTITTGDISGTVADPTGAVVANAKVTLTNDATGEAAQTTTSASGEYRFSLLRPGIYTIVVASSGFEDSVVKASASLGQISTANIKLGIKRDITTVNVIERAPLIQTDNANLATTYDSKQLENLPAPGNDMTAYAFTAPGVTMSTGAGYGNFSAFGLPGTSNLFTVNGTDNMDPYLNLNGSGASNLTLGANEVQEAAVVLNGYTGQYGRQAGAQVNFITRSGSNQFHGNAGWQWNGSKLNANDFFNNATGTERPHAVSNEWTDSIGGPIKKNKAFFFFDNEGIRYVLPSGGPVYIPTTSFANAVLAHLQQMNPASTPFYQTAFNLYNGASGASRATPLTAAQDSALGCGDLAGNIGAFGVTTPCARVFQNGVNNLNTEWLLGAKVDVNLSANDRIYFRYSRDRGVQATGTDPINTAFNANSVQPTDTGQFGYTRTLGSTMVNQLLASATYYDAIFGPPDFASAIKTFPTTWLFGDGAPYNNLGGADFIYPQGRKVRQWQLIDDFSKIWGTHTFKAGTNIRKNWVSSYATLPNQTGTLVFNSMTDFYEGSFGNGSTYAQAFPQVGAENVTLYSAGFYLQDEWKVRPNLTLTLALRFDRNSNITCAAKCFNEFLSPFEGVSHNASTPYNATIHTGVPQAFTDLEPIVTEPRIGVAYGLTKSTVLRGGFGIFSDLYPAVLADRFITNSPQVSTFTTSSGLVALNNPNSVFAITTASNSAFLKGFNNGATLAQLQQSVNGFSMPAMSTIASTLRNPKYYEWNFEVQQSLGKSYMLSMNYVGNRGYDEFNQTLFGNAYAPHVAGLPTAAPDPRFGEIREFSNAGHSNYNGLVSSFRWRMGSDFTGSLSYTWSHALDTCSNACVLPFNVLSAPSIRFQLDPANLSYSNADYDTRHSFSANYVYTVPTRYFSSSILKHALGGWTVAGTVFFHSGYPFSIVDSLVRSRQKISNAAGLNTQSFLAAYLGNGYPSCTTPNGSCYSASQFVSASNQTNFGNVPRNSFRGPGYFNTDMNIAKTIALHERYKLQFGAFFFNLFNHPNFDNPFNNLALGNFGQIQATVSAPTSAYGAFQGAAVSGRVVQTAIKFMF